MTTILLEERFVVKAPIERVWDHLVDPRRVVACVPGGELDEVVDERTFLGKVRIGIGPLTLDYRGRVRLEGVDAPGRRVTIVGEARERAGTDSARLTLESWITPLAGGGAQVVARTRVDVAGRVLELGRGVLGQLGHLVFQDFASRVRAALEAQAPGAVPPPGAAEPGPPPREDVLRAIPLVLRALGAWLAGALRGGGGPSAEG